MFYAVLLLFHLHVFEVGMGTVWALKLQSIYLSCSQKDCLMNFLPAEGLLARGSTGYSAVEGDWRESRRSGLGLQLLILSAPCLYVAQAGLDLCTLLGNVILSCITSVYVAFV